MFAKALLSRAAACELAVRRSLGYLDNVLDAINGNSQINVTAHANGDRIRLLDNTGLEVSNLKVQEVGSGTTAAAKAFTEKVKKAHKSDPLKWDDRCMGTAWGSVFGFKTGALVPYLTPGLGFVVKRDVWRGVALFVLINGISIGISDSNPISSAFVVGVTVMALAGLAKQLWMLAAIFLIALAMVELSKIPLGFFVRRVLLFIPLFTAVVAIPA